jgi:hypothetical protein
VTTYILIFKIALVAHSAATIDHFTARVLGPMAVTQNSAPSILTLEQRIQRKLQPAGYVVRLSPPGDASPVDAAQVGAGLYEMYLRYGDDEAEHMDESLPQFICEVTHSGPRKEPLHSEVDVSCHR